MTIEIADDKTNENIDGITDTHLSDAEKFFEENPDPEEDNGKLDTKVVEKSTKDNSDGDPKKEPTVEDPNPLDAILKPKVVDTSDTDEDGESKDPEKNPIDDLVEPKDEKAKAGWNELKTIANSARDEAAKYRAEVEELKAKQTVDPAAHAATDERVKELETLNEQMSSRLKLLDLQSHPDFQKEFVMPREAKLKEMQSYVDEEVPLGAILQLPPKEFAAKISEVASEMDDFAKTQLYTMARDYRNLSVKANEALKNVDTTSESFAAANKAQSKQVFDQVAAQYSQSNMFIPQEIPDDATPELKAKLEAYNAGYQSIGQEAENMAFGQVDQVGVAKMAHEAALYRFVMKHGLPRLGSVVGDQLKTATARVKELEAKIAGIKANGANPTYGNDGDGDGTTDPSQLSHLEAAQLVDWGAR